MLKRLLITEEALRNREGHWYEYNRATKAALLEYDPTMHVDMLGHQSMDDEVARDLPAVAQFRYTVWDQIYNQPQAWKRYLGIVQHNLRLYRDLSKYLKSQPKYDVVFAPTVVLHHLLAYHALAKRLGGKKLGQLILLIRNNIALYDKNGQRTFRSTAKFWRWAIQRFKPLLQAGVVRFVTDSERLADEYEELTGIRFQVLPHPSLLGLESKTGFAAAADHRSDRVQIFLPGPSRSEKGTDRLIDACDQLSEEVKQRIEVTLQWSEAFDSTNGTKIDPDMLSEIAPGVCFRLLRQPLSSSEYRHELCRADLIVLPYRRDTYFARISGVAVEAMLLGKPLLYTSNTWVATIAEQFKLGLAMDDDATGVAVALATAINSIQDLRTVAEQKVDVVASFFSAEQFARQLLTGMNA